MNLEGREQVEPDFSRLSVVDAWMYHKVNQASAGVEQALSAYRFNEAAQHIYDVFWNDFCDWYVEGRSSISPPGAMSRRIWP